VRRLTRAIATLAMSVALFWAIPVHAEKRVALLIGNNDYGNVVSLKTAVNDAHALGDVLQKLGFAVLVADNQSRRAMSEALSSFERLIAPGDTVLLFYAGHGFEIAGGNYLLPTDVPAATEGQEGLLRDAAFDAQQLSDRLQARGARTTILVLDACRDNPFPRSRTRAIAGTAGLAPMTPPEGVFIVFSAGAKQTALDRLGFDDPNPNSVFTRNFLQQLSRPGLTLVQIAKLTQSAVKQMAATVRHDQTPAYYDQIVGDLVLNGSAEAAPSTVLIPQLAALPPLARPAEPPVNAPIADFTRHNGGWSVTFSFVEPTTAISWRLGETGPFRETGFLNVLDPRTRRRLPISSIELDADATAATLYVRYVDQNGLMVGPFPIRFDPTTALAQSQRKILEMTAGSWLSFRDFNGLLLYYTHLVVYRCAVREFRIGIDTSLPDRVVTLPACDQKDPMALPSNAQPYLHLPSATRAVSIELTYRDGSVSEIKTFRR
jgi:hypothetical protein